MATFSTAVVVSHSLYEFPGAEAAQEWLSASRGPLKQGQISRSVHGSDDGLKFFTYEQWADADSAQRGSSADDAYQAYCKHAGVYNLLHSKAQAGAIAQLSNEAIVVMAHFVFADAAEARASADHGGSLALPAGAIAYNIHLSLDGLHTFYYEQWESMEAFGAWGEQLKGLSWFGDLVQKIARPGIYKLLFTV